MARKRLAICRPCPNFAKTDEGCLSPGTAPCCSICGCKLGWMTRVPEERCSDTQNPRWLEET